MKVIDYEMMIEDKNVKKKIIEYRRRGKESLMREKGDGEMIEVELKEVMEEGI